MLGVFCFFLTPPLTLLIELDITDEVLVDVRSFLVFFDASPNLTHCQPPVPHLWQKICTTNFGRGGGEGVTLQLGKYVIRHCRIRLVVRFLFFLESFKKFGFSTKKNSVLGAVSYGAQEAIWSWVPLKFLKKYSSWAPYVTAPKKDFVLEAYPNFLKDAS